jgi:hypothetical protein
VWKPVATVRFRVGTGCNGSVPGWNRTRNQPGNLDPLLTRYLTSEVALEKPEIGSTYPIIPIVNISMDDEPHVGMPGDSRDYKDEGGDSD